MIAEIPKPGLTGLIDNRFGSAQVLVPSPDCGRELRKEKDMPSKLAIVKAADIRFLY